MIWRQISIQPPGSAVRLRVEVCMDDPAREAVVLKRTGDHWVPIECVQDNITDDERTVY